MIPLPVNTPWRLIGAVAVVAAILGGLWFVYGRIHAAGEAEGRDAVLKAWHDANVEEDRQTALLEAKAREKEEADRIAAKRIEDELQSRLFDADKRSSDLARRLREYAARDRQRSLSDAARATAGADGAAGEPGDSGEARTAVDAALEAHLGACARDAERLAGWQSWWQAVNENHPPGG